MREIKFRGVTHEFSSPRWVYGDLICDCTDEPRIMTEYHDCDEPVTWTVDPDTVGQYTGLYDTDGREIYEGDVLGNKYTSHYKFANAVVEWGVDGWLADCFSLREFLKLHTCIVVGNIYDNSELLPELPEEDDARD